MRLHIFPFSERSGTKAYNYKDRVSNAIKKQRENKLFYLAGDLSREFAEGFVNSIERVLVEDKRTSEGHLQGYTEHYVKVLIDGDDNLKGQLINCCFILTNGKPYGIISFNSLGL